MDMTKYKEAAVLAAKEGGAVHKKYFRGDIEVKTKGATYDLVTVADVEAEEKIISIIRERFPDHNFLAEEAKYEKAESPYTWIIDPLDGTNNFASGMPIFCASVALAKNDEVLVGAIYDVTRNELFCAERGGGAFLNGKRISVSSVDDLKDSLLITGFYYDRGPKMLDTLDNIKKFFQQSVMGLRRLGSAALDLCYVASGRVAGFWEFELSPWDFAAGKLLVEEAGGKITGRFGEPVDTFKKSFIVASNGSIHQKMLEVLK